jgi:hypothetical protein
MCNSLRQFLNRIHSFVPQITFFTELQGSSVSVAAKAPVAVPCFGDGFAGLGGLSPGKRNWNLKLYLLICLVFWLQRLDLHT